MTGIWDLGVPNCPEWDLVITWKNTQMLSLQPKVALRLTDVKWPWMNMKRNTCCFVCMKMLWLWLWLCLTVNVTVTQYRKLESNRMCWKTYLYIVHIYSTHGEIIELVQVLDANLQGSNFKHCPCVSLCPLTALDKKARTHSGAHWDKLLQRLAGTGTDLWPQEARAAISGSGIKTLKTVDQLASFQKRNSSDLGHALFRF